MEDSKQSEQEFRLGFVRHQLHLLKFLGDDDPYSNLPNLKLKRKKVKLEKDIDELYPIDVYVTMKLQKSDTVVTRKKTMQQTERKQTIQPFNEFRSASTKPTRQSGLHDDNDENKDWERHISSVLKFTNRNDTQPNMKAILENLQQQQAKFNKLKKQQRVNQKKILNSEFANTLSAETMGYFGWSTMDIDNVKNFRKTK